MNYEFVPPDFVEENDAEAIQERMMNNLPSDIDNTEGGFPYDFTMPTAIEKSEFIQFHIVRTLMLMFPMWAWDEWLDYHASIAKIKRKEAGYASGTLLIEGEVGTKIKEGTLFSTVAKNDELSIEFELKKEYIIPEQGCIEVDIQAVQAGKQGNVGSNTITLMINPIDGIKSVTNPSLITGGTEEEDDESLRQRIQEKNESIDTSCIGNNSDYIRWAKEVIGVGSATVIPEWNGAGTVKLILTDSNGEAANEQILNRVYEHIMATNNPIERLAPIGAKLTVVAPTTIPIVYSAEIKLFASDIEMEYVINQFKENLKKYYEIAREENIIKYTKICAVLSNTVGVSDFSQLSINGQQENILLSEEIFPKTGDVIFTKVGV